MIAGCGGAGSGHATTAATHSDQRSAARPASPPQLAYHSLYSLPAPLRDPASATLEGGRFVLIGGLDAADTSTGAIELADLRGVLHTTSLPVAQHDAQGAPLSDVVYVFGGGSFSELNHIVSFNPGSGLVNTVGALPRAQSDVAVTAAKGTAYIVGGYDGIKWLDTIIAWHPGTTAKVVAHLPVGLRYASASAVNGQILVIGGSTPAGASDAVYRFDPATNRVQTIGRLSRPITHAAAATLGSYVYLVGGRGNDPGSQSAEIWSINPRSGHVRAAGRLPRPLSDLAALAVGRVLIVAGGLSPQATEARVGELVPRPTP